jgi:cell division protein FtsW
MELNRGNKNIITSWWWTVDRLTITALVLLIAFSALMVATASPAVADRIGVESFYFVRRQLVYILIACTFIIGISLLPPVAVRRFAMFGLFIGIIFLVIVLFKATEIKGSKRWISLLGFSLQPSEFVKPFFEVVIGWVLSRKYTNNEFPSFKIAFLLYGIVVSLIILQPDFGMVVTISLVWAGQLFLAGLSMVWIITVIILAIFGIIGAYLFLPHVTKRINSFLDPTNSENYQIKKSIEAFMNGGLYGQGPGEGTVKQFLPDSHTDFIFAVVGEELGVISCCLIILLFAFIVIRGFIRLSNEPDLFVTFAASGLLMQFGIQAMINMGVTLRLLPTKGMTLPFISYGGSSMIAISIAMGMLLALTRKRYGIVKFSFRSLHNRLYH